MVSGGGNTSGTGRVQDEHGGEQGRRLGRGRRGRGDFKLALVVCPADLTPNVALLRDPLLNA